MQTIELNGLLRAASGKQEITQLKKDNRIPCVIYGGGENVGFGRMARTELRPVPDVAFQIMWSK